MTCFVLSVLEPGMRVGEKYQAVVPDLIGRLIITVKYFVPKYLVTFISL